MCKEETQTGGESPGGSILVSKGTKSSEATNSVTVDCMKGNCRNVWCPPCFKRGRAKKIAKRLSSFDWQSSRHVVLSFDPAKYDHNPKKAYLEARKKKYVAKAIYKLEDKHNITIRDWVWCIEWYRNGFPHWHIIIDVEKKGKAGQIGQDKIHDAWGKGRIHESFFRNEKHFREFTGYFEKAGYFDKKKAHQAILPDWAIEANKSGEIKHIKRSDSKRLPKTEIEKAEKRIKIGRRDDRKFTMNMERNLDELDDHENGMFSNPDRDEENEPKRVRSYPEIFESCGMTTTLCVTGDRNEQGYYFLDVPFAEFLKQTDQFWFSSKRGRFTAKLPVDTLDDIFQEFVAMPDPLDQLPF